MILWSPLIWFSFWQRLSPRTVGTGDVASRLYPPALIPSPPGDQARSWRHPICPSPWGREALLPAPKIVAG